MTGKESSFEEKKERIRAIYGEKVVKLLKPPAVELLWQWTEETGKRCKIGPQQLYELLRANNTTAENTPLHVESDQEIKETIYKLGDEITREMDALIDALDNTDN